MEQPENKEEVIQGDIDLQSLHLGKTVHRRCAELVKTADGKNDGNTANKKGNTKNRKSAVEQSAMVRKNNVTNNKSVQSWYLYLLTPLDKKVANAHRFRCLSLNIMDGQLWRRRMEGGGGGGEFSGRMNLFPVNFSLV